MNKDQLYGKLNSIGYFHAGREYPEEQVRKVLDEFFDSAIVIPKGINRHPYADVLHEWIEGVEIEVLLNGEWTDYLCDVNYIKKYEYRIKPCNPVYEYRWYRIDTDEVYGFYADTDPEAISFYKMSNMVKLTETKRERKQ